MKYIKLFEKFITLKLNDNWRETTELVPIEQLNRFKEFNRRVRPNPFSIGPDEISLRLIEEGINDPLIIDYSKLDRAVLLIEGNNRLVVANELGLKYLPARVVRRERRFSKDELAKSMKVTGVEPDRSGYVPGNMKPSQVGIPGCKPITTGTESLYEGSEFLKYKEVFSEDEYFKTRTIYLEYSYNGHYKVKERYDNLYKAVKKAIEVIEEHTGFDNEKGFALISSGSYLNTGEDTNNPISFIDWKNLIKWYGNCVWEEKAKEISNLILYNKYLYGLEAAYDKYIVDSENAYKIAKYIEEKNPEMWKILSFHDPNIITGSDMGRRGFGD